METTGNVHQPQPGADLLAGCQDYATAMRKAEEMLLANRRASHSAAAAGDDAFWDRATARVLCCYLHAIALSGLPVRSVKAWLDGRAYSTTAAEILAAHPGACRDAAGTLQSLLDPRSPRTTDAIRRTAAGVFEHATGHRLT